MSVDPQAAFSPGHSPYHYTRNNPIYFLDPDGQREFPARYRGKLGPGDWRTTDRFHQTQRFHNANIYNTNRLAASEYKPVFQIHGYYKWAANQIDQGTSGIKFFHATRDVTGKDGVGGAFHFLPDWANMGSEARDALSKINAMLLEHNMPVIRDILSNGATDLVEGSSGMEISLNLVRFEQKAVTNFLKTNPLSNKAAAEINFWLNFFALTQEHLKIAQKLVGGFLDFRKEEHRIAIGQTMVNLQYNPSYGSGGSSQSTGWEAEHGAPPF